MSDSKNCKKCGQSTGTDVAIYITEGDGSEYWFCDYLCAASFCIDRQLSKTEFK